MKNKILTLESIFTFGRHKDEQVEDVADDDPKYIAYLINEEICEFDEEAMKKFEELKIV